MERVEQKNVRKVYVRECPSCGFLQKCMNPKRYKDQLFEPWLDRRCGRCRNFGLQVVGKYMSDRKRNKLNGRA